MCVNTTLNAQTYNLRLSKYTEAVLIVCLHFVHCFHVTNLFAMSTCVHTFNSIQWQHLAAFLSTDKDLLL